MENEERVHKEIDKTMKALDGLERASADEYFFTRLEARMEHRRDATTVVPRLSWGIAAVMMIIMLNVFTLMYYWDADTISEQEITALAEEYALTVPSLYEQEINE